MCWWGQGSLFLSHPPHRTHAPTLQLHSRGWAGLGWAVVVINGWILVGYWRQTADGRRQLGPRITLRYCGFLSGGERIRGARKRGSEGARLRELRVVSKINHRQRSERQWTAHSAVRCGMAWDGACFESRLLPGADDSTIFVGDRSGAVVCAAVGFCYPEW